MKNRRALFENRYIRCLRDLYTGLPAETQLKSLCLAVQVPAKLGQGPPKEISLYDYFTNGVEGVNNSSPVEAAMDISDRTRYRMCVNEAMCVSLERVRGQPAKWNGIAGDLLTSLASEAAGELSRVYEYQICMLRERTAVELLAKHAAECAMEYTVRGDRQIRRNRLCHAALLAKPASVNSSPKCSVILGDNEYKWALYATLKLAGLREDLTYAAARDQDTPLTLATAYYEGGVDGENDSARYGYRGQFVDWDTLTGGYLSSCPLDLSLKSLEQAPTTDDNTLHRRYTPYSRLVGANTMKAYLDVVDSASEPVSLNEYVSRVVGRDLATSLSINDGGKINEVKPVYRPLVGEDQPCLEGRKFVDVDMTRVRHKKSSVQLSTVLMEEVGQATEERAISKSNIVETTTTMNNSQDREGIVSEGRRSEERRSNTNSPFSDNGRTSNDSGNGESVTDAFDRVDSNANDVVREMRVPKKSCLKKPREVKKQPGQMVTRKELPQTQSNKEPMQRKSIGKREQQQRELQPVREKRDVCPTREIRKDNRLAKPIRSTSQMHYGTAV